MTKYFSDKCKQEKIIASTVEFKNLDLDASVGSGKPLGVFCWSDTPTYTVNSKGHEISKTYRITFVYKLGEKNTYSGRGPKPKGYNVYENGLFKEFLPYD